MSKVTPETSPRRNLGRPKSEEKRQQILEAARDLFLEHGYEVTSVDSIASRAGVSKATVYSHFDGKTGLVEAVIKQRSKGLTEHFSGQMEPSDDVRADLVGFSVGLSKAVLPRENRPWDRLVIAESHRHPELAQTLFKVGPTLVLERLTACLKTHCEAGRLEIGDIEAAAEQFIGMTLGFEFVRSLMASQTRRSDAYWKLRAESAADLFLSRYGKAAQSGRPRGARS